MPEIVMPHATGSTSMVGTANKIEERRWYTEKAGDSTSDEFSDSDDSSGGESDGQQPGLTTHKSLPTQHRNTTSKISTNTTSKISTNTSSKISSNITSKISTNTTSKISSNTTSKTASSALNNEKRRIAQRFINDRTISIEEKTKETEKDDQLRGSNNEDTNGFPECAEEIKYTLKDLQPLFAGQSKDELEVPIMTPPPVPVPQPTFSFQIPPNGTFQRPFSLSFLDAGEKSKCGFTSELNFIATEKLTMISDNRKNKECHCSGACAPDDSIIGWERSEKNGKSKTGRKRKVKNTPIDPTTFLRLTGALNGDKDDPVAFQYYEDSKKYIERYRFFHSVGNICRPRSVGVKEVMPVKKDIENEPYFKNLKTSCAMATECDLYTLISNAKLKKEKQEVKRPASSKSSGSDHEKSKSEDDESYEEGNSEVKSFSMRDRGKTLNLAPVRECMVPDLIPTDRFEQYQQNYIELNQYLNLMTPPSPGQNLQFQIDELREKRFGNRILNMADNSWSPLYSPRRGAMPLRLGSAEFVKPGSGETEPKWASEAKQQQQQTSNNLQRAPTFHSSTVPGNLIVGSTITQLNQPVKVRPRHGGKSSPFMAYTKEQMANLPGQNQQTPPHHIFGRKYKPCERLTDLSVSKERLLGKFPYTHSAPSTVNSKVPTQCRTVMAVDLKDASAFKRQNIKQITLDVNHLGIRGRTFQSGQITVLYKDRRTSSVNS